MDMRRLSETSRRVALVGICAAALLLVACRSRGGQVGQVQSDATVRRELAVVRAGPASVNPLPELTDDQDRPLPAGGLVTTDANGEASVLIGNCERIFIFQNSGLIKTACPKSEVSSGTVTCSVEGTSVFNNDCAGQVVIQTPSADVSPQGTWLSVTYLSNRQLSLVMVYEGQVEVWPVLDADQRTLGEGRTIKEGFFWYSAPDAVLRPIQGLPPRQPIPFEEMPPVVEVLNLRSWMERIRARAEQDGIPFPEVLLEEPALRAVQLLVGGGGPLKDPGVQEAVLRGVPWAELSASIFPDQDVPVIVVLGDQSVDARAVGHDPGQARELLAAAGFPNGFGLVLLTPPNDREIIVMAREVAASLADIGIEVRLSTVAPAEAPGAINGLVRSGQAVLWMNRR
ncbi:MAG: hypothetical protein M5U01_43690 [Ardenticatenaceae bacterium]|nr:hypothetical protein [Ardenticatenaceae bacterium]HBY96354.1 hypothetical protein [Chloroflexota bacterium]